MSRPWMPLYVADYLADTAHLSAAEHGAYLLLIMHYWKTGGLPADERKLARIARMSDREWARARETVAEFFSGDWRHARIDRELLEAKEAYERRANAGRKGGVSKQNQEPDASIASAKPKQSQSQSHSSSLRSDEPRAVDREIDAEFEREFWPKYPHKVGKPDARKAFARCRKRHDLAAILGGLAAYVAGKPVDRPWLNPSTFLNQERFNDRPANVEARAGPEPRRSKLSEMAFGNFFDDPSDHDHIGQPAPGASKPDVRGHAGDLSQRGGADASGTVVDLRQTGAGWR